MSFTDPGDISEDPEESKAYEDSIIDEPTDQSSHCESETSDVSVTPSDDAPRTADTTAFGMIIAAMTISLGTLMLTGRKKKE